MKKLINFRLPFMLAISLALGIAVGYFVYMKNYLMLTIFCVGYFACLVYFCIYSSKINKTKISLYFSIAFIVFSLVGFLGFYLITSNYDNTSLYEGTYSVTGKIVKVDITDTGNRYLLDDVKVVGKNKVKYKLELNVIGDTGFDIGDVVKFSSVVSDKNSIYEGRFLASYLAEGVKFYSSVYSEEVEFVKSSPNVYQKINLKIKDTLKENLDYDVFAVAYALLTGGDEYINDDVISTFRNTGVAHIFAVSGLHIGFLALVLDVVQKKLKLRGIIKVCLTAVILFGYSGVCGFSSSSIRACIMSTILSTSSLFGERYDGISSISIAGIVILLFKPLQLLCVGFQLSFAVALGILVLSPAIKRKFIKIRGAISSSLSTVIAAQLTGIPILLYSFGQFSIVSIIVNLIFIPVVGVIYIILLVCTLLTIICGMGNVLLFIPNYSLKFLTVLIDFFDRDFFIVGGVSFGVFAIFYYLAIFIASGMFNLRRMTNLLLGIVMSLICVFGVVIKTNNSDSQGVYVSGSMNFSFTLVSENDENTLIISDVANVFSVSRLKRIKEREKVKDLDTVILMNVGVNTDAYNILGKIYSVYEISQFKYYGEENLMLEHIVKKTFLDVEISEFCDGKFSPQNRTEFICEKNGKCLSFTTRGKKLSVFSPFKSEVPDFLEICHNPDLIICYDYAESISAVYRSSEIISYVPTVGFNDAESSGNIKYYLS